MAPAPRAALALFSAALSLARGAPPTFENPVVRADAPDPGVVFDADAGLFFSSTTTGNDPAGCFYLRSSPDLAAWTDLGYAFAAGRLPAWIDPANPSCWAPEIHRCGGAWRMYFVGRQRGGLLSIGVASSAAGPAGPWVDSGAPLVQDGGAAPQGQIDPTLARDAAGAPVLVFKTDGNADGRPTPIRAAALDAGNCSALAPGADWATTELITNTLAWEGPLVEAPWVVERNGTFFLFYSGNGYGDASYAVGVARAPALKGPYEKHGAPILRTAPGAAPTFPGPGHCSVVEARDGATAIVYHAHGAAGGPARHTMLDALAWVPDGAGGEWPAMESGQPYPGVGVQRVP